jgi:DNA-binding transcriptional MerR regulator/methylmalonyl-CoA mutase cobalamin-binding subunit
MYNICTTTGQLLYMAANTDISTASYPISAVSALTGINPVTLRAWERRYGLIEPKRTTKGHRLYSSSDIERIREILRLVEEGIPIGQVRHALDASDTPPADISAEDSWRQYLDRMISAIERFDEAGLEQVYNDAMALYPVEIVTRRLLVPLLQELGERWANTTGSVAEEHFFGVYMRNKLGARFHHRQGRPKGPRIVAACIPGELHELGLLLFGLAAHDRGFQIILLGADMPLEELPIVVSRTNCEAIVLSGSVKPSEDVLTQSLPELVRRAGVPVFIGGNTASRFKEEIAAAGAISVGNDLVLGLRDIDSALNRFSA